MKPHFDCLPPEDQQEIENRKSDLTDWRKKNGLRISFKSDPIQSVIKEYLDCGQRAYALTPSRLQSFMWTILPTDMPEKAVRPPHSCFYVGLEGSLLPNPYGPVSGGLDYLTGLYVSEEYVRKRLTGLKIVSIAGDELWLFRIPLTKNRSRDGTFNLRYVPPEWTQHGPWYYQIIHIALCCVLFIQYGGNREGMDKMPIKPKLRLVR